MVYVFSFLFTFNLFVSFKSIFLINRIWLCLILLFNLCLLNRIFMPFTFSVVIIKIIRFKSIILKIYFICTICCFLFSIFPPFKSSILYDSLWSPTLSVVYYHLPSSDRPLCACLRKSLVLLSCLTSSHRIAWTVDFLVMIYYCPDDLLI